MQIGVQVTGDYDHVVTIARITEASNAVALALADHYLYGSTPGEYSAPAYDSFVQAAALGRDTRELDLVMLVSPITFRHPAVYAKGSITIDEISNGRFTFGLGTGWHDDEHAYFGIDYPSLAERFDLLEDALGYLRQFFDDPTAGHQGPHYSFTGFDARPRARQGGRTLLVGGGGAVRTPTLAGKYADEFNLYHHDPDGIAARVAVMRRAAEAAGRDPDAVLVSTCMPVIGGDTEAEVEEMARVLIAARGADPDEVLERWRDSRGIHMGTWDQHAEFIERLGEAGIQRTYLQLAAGDVGHLERALAALA